MYLVHTTNRRNNTRYHAKIGIKYINHNMEYKIEILKFEY